MPSTAYLGPEGTFTQQALQAFDPDAQARPMSSVDAALAAVRRGATDTAMVPIENSVEGGVSATLDGLVQDDGLQIVGEQLLPITFVLAARPGTGLAQVRRVGTHPHAWAQVRGFVYSRIPDAEHVPTPSTAGGAARLADGTASFEATACARVAATNHGLEILADDIGERRAVTRFVMVAPRGTLPAPTGADKTTIVVFQCEDRVGGLIELLEQFAGRGINMTRVESRPAGSAMGAYCFSIDFEGHVDDARVGEALVSLRRLTGDVRFLGSYPRAGTRPAALRRSGGEVSLAAARSWLKSLRAGDRARPARAHAR